MDVFLSLQNLEVNILCLKLKLLNAKVENLFTFFYFIEFNFIIRFGHLVVFSTIRCRNKVSFTLSYAKLNARNGSGRNNVVFLTEHLRGTPLKSLKSKMFLSLKNL